MIEKKYNLGMIVFGYAKVVFISLKTKLAERFGRCGRGKAQNH